jgi:FAD/FMN-containing dehydrogenase
LEIGLVPTATIEELASAIGPGKVLTDEQQLASYPGIAWGTADGRLPLPRPLGLPAAIVQPASTDDVVKTVFWARRTATPLIPYGAGTGVHAGAAPLEGSVVLDLGAMRQIHSISAADQMAEVDPGVVLGDLDQAAQSHGLMVGHDPWSQPIASVGGAISTNGVGYLAGKYGAMGEQVLGLEVVLGSGDVVRTRAVPKSSTGPTMRHFFIGGEGAFGIITRAEVRLFPLPESRVLRGYWFPRLEDGLEAVMGMRAIDLQPSMIDYEEDSDQSTAELGRLVDTPSEMYLAFEGFREEVEVQLERADRLCQTNHGTEMSGAEAQKFWDERHEPATRYVAQKQAGTLRRTRGTTSSYLNIGLAASAIQPFRERAARELASYRLTVTSCGLWGMPELVSVRFQHQAPEDARAAEETEAGTDLGFRIVHEMGGSMEYCHGVGVRLAHLMEAEWGAGLDALRAIKRALDPDGILNPGKLGL